MGRVFFRGWQLRAAVSAAILLGFGLLPGVAGATTPSSGTVSSSNTTITFTAPDCSVLTGNPASTFCTGVPNFSTPTCDLSMMNPCPVGTSPASCPLASIDMTNSVCEHFALTVVEAGTVSVCIIFPSGFGFNDVDIFAVQLDGSGQAVAVAADSSTGSGPTPGSAPDTLQQCVSFGAAAGTTFDVQLSPSFLVGPIGTGEISGLITFTPGTPPPPPPPQGVAKFTGGGQLGDGANVSLNAFGSDTSRGGVRFKLSATCAVVSKTLSFVSVQGSGLVPGGSSSSGFAQVNGSGKDLSGNSVSFQIKHATDNGEGGSQTTPDNFDITITDSGGAMVCQEPLFTPLAKGNFQYHPAAS